MDSSGTAAGRGVAAPDSHSPSDPRGRSARRGLLLAALAMVAVAIGLALTGIESERGPCGTLLGPAWAEDMRTDRACDAAYRQRAIVTGVLTAGAISLAIASGVARGRASRR